jgi:hypothetical protein
MSLSWESRPRAFQPCDIFVAGHIGILAVDALAGPIGGPVGRTFQKLRGAESVRQHDPDRAFVSLLPQFEHAVLRKLSEHSSSGASAARTMGISCALVPIASRSCLWARKAFEVPMKPRPRLEAMALTTYSCHRKLCRRRVPKSATLRPGTPRRRSILLHSLVFARAYRMSR